MSCLRFVATAVVQLQILLKTLLLIAAACSCSQVAVARCLFLGILNKLYTPLVKLTKGTYELPAPSSVCRSNFHTSSKHLNRHTTVQTSIIAYDSYKGINMPKTPNLTTRDVCSPFSRLVEASQPSRGLLASRSRLLFRTLSLRNGGTWVG